MNNMEIKQGDKVRVDKAIPNMYLVGFGYAVLGDECKVREIDEGNALIKWKDNYITIPTKYLIKVDAEAKEAKFKKGDKVRFKKVYTVVSVDDGQVFIDSAGNHIDEDYLEPYIEPTAPTIKVGDRVKIKRECLDCNKPIDDTYTFSVIPSEVVMIEDDMATLYMTDSIPPKTLWARVDILEKLAEPKEQTEEDARIRQMEAELDEFRKAELDRVLHPEKYYTYEVTVDNVAMDWQRYEADLAKEIALKVANKYNDPEQAADYAVRVAKAVVEGLKRK